MLVTEFKQELVSAGLRVSWDMDQRVFITKDEKGKVKHRSDSLARLGEGLSASKRVLIGFGVTIDGVSWHKTKCRAEFAHMLYRAIRMYGEDRVGYWGSGPRCGKCLCCYRAEKRKKEVKKGL